MGDILYGNWDPNKQKFRGPFPVALDYHFPAIITEDFWKEIEDDQFFRSIYRNQSDMMTDPFWDYVATGVALGGLMLGFTMSARYILEEYGMAKPYHFTLRMTGRALPWLEEADEMANAAEYPIREYGNQPSMFFIEPTQPIEKEHWWHKLNDDKWFAGHYEKEEYVKQVLRTDPWTKDEYLKWEKESEQRKKDFYGSDGSIEHNFASVEDFQSDEEKKVPFKAIYEDEYGMSAYKIGFPVDRELDNPSEITGDHSVPISDDPDAPVEEYDIWNDKLQFRAQAKHWLDFCANRIVHEYLYRDKVTDMELLKHYPETTVLQLRHLPETFKRFFFLMGNKRVEPLDVHQINELSNQFTEFLHPGLRVGHGSKPRKMYDSFLTTLSFVFSPLIAPVKWLIFTPPISISREQFLDFFARCTTWLSSPECESNLTDWNSPDEPDPTRFEDYIFLSKAMIAEQMGITVTEKFFQDIEDVPKVYNDDPELMKMWKKMWDQEKYIIDKEMKRRLEYLNTHHHRKLVELVEIWMAENTMRDKVFALFHYFPELRYAAEKAKTTAEVKFVF